jgi:hypothetical protein
MYNRPYYSPPLLSYGLMHDTRPSEPWSQRESESEERIRQLLGIHGGTPFSGGTQDSSVLILKGRDPVGGANRLNACLSYHARNRLKAAIKSPGCGKPTLAIIKV